MVDLVSIIENEGRVLHEIREYLSSHGITDEDFMDKLNDMFEEIHKES